MKSIIISIYLILGIFLAYPSYSNGLNLKIKDSSGEELIGASIELNNKIYYSDLEGSLTLDIPEGEHEIRITYISFEPQTIRIDSINEKKDIVVIMKNRDFKIPTPASQH